jgi:ABC-type cobalamin/Fe3+-siderophores transport system ATPase subunit
MEITIPLQPDSSITKNVPISLSNYTVFAGENNSGKTNLIKGIISTIGKDNVIYIPAEQIDALSQMKTGAKDDPMRDAISKLLNVVLDEAPKMDGNFKELFTNIEKTFNSFDIANTSLKLDSKNFEKKELEKMLRDAIAAKILDHTILDMYYGSEKKITVDSVGQGVQRLIIAAIIQEIGKIKVIDQEIIILFEEPEIYLHPKLKEKLHSSLVELSTKPNVKIILTTHDPYFIQLAKDKKIYHVLRDSEGSTYIKEIVGKSLPETWRSFSEINYQVFGVNGEEYLNELYGYIESKFNNWKDVDNELMKKEKQDKQRKHLGSRKMTMTSYIRHEIHHKTSAITYTHSDVIMGISNLQAIITEKGY